MRVYHFTGARYGIEDIQNRRLKVARIAELNDLFEFASADLSDDIHRRALRAVKDQLNQEVGMLCFSRTWHDPVQWGHYADKHKGICLGFDVDDAKLLQVTYVRSRGIWPEKIDADFMKTIVATKFAHWNYEDEYRLWVELAERENGLYFAGFSNAMRLCEVIVGPQSGVKRADVVAALGDLTDVKTFRARAAFRSFRIVRNKNDELWK